MTDKRNTLYLKIDFVKKKKEGGLPIYNDFL